MPLRHGGRQAQYHLNLIDSLLRNESSSLDRGEAPRMTSQIPKVPTCPSLLPLAAPNVLASFLLSYFLCLFIPASFSFHLCAAAPRRMVIALAGKREHSALHISWAILGRDTQPEKEQLPVEIRLFWKPPLSKACLPELGGRVECVCHAEQYANGGELIKFRTVSTHLSMYAIPRTESCLLHFIICWVPLNFFSSIPNISPL